MTDEPVLAIGVDGGASGVRALAVRRRPDGLLEAAGEFARRDHEPFEAVDLEVQRAEAAEPRRDDAEVAAARRRLCATVDVVEGVSRGIRRIALGVCWPGLKTLDQRGVAILRNGPRDPRFLDQLAQELAARGFELDSPIPPLASDGVAGALGERWSLAGGLHDVADALYFAGGSGLAEALLVAGRVRALDEFGPSLPKAWEMSIREMKRWQWELHSTELQLARCEDLLSPGRWARSGVLSSSDLASGFPSGRVDWLVAFQRDPATVRRILGMAARALVGYIQDRMERLRSPAGIVPECAVVGARLGLLLAHPELRRSLGDPVRAGLEGAGLPPDFVRASTLLEAPCFGAAALALGLEDAACPS